MVGSYVFGSMVLRGNDPLSSLLALRNNTEQKSFVMVRVPAQQPKMTSRIKCFVWNWLRKYAQVHEGNDVDSTPPASTTFC